MRERIPALQREPEVPKRRFHKLFALLIIALVIVLVVLFFRSSLSKVTQIVVIGTHHLHEQQVMESLGIAVGDSFFTPGSAKLASNVERLPPVKQVKVIKKFPGTVEVHVQEYAEVAAEIGADGEIRIVLENGLTLPVEPGVMPDRPILTGWEPDSEVRRALCMMLGTLPHSLLHDLSEIKPDPSNAYPDRIKLFTRSRFEVITTVAKLPEKIPYLSEIVENRAPGQLILLEADTYSPYSAQTTSQTGEEEDKHKDNGTTQ